MPTQKPLNTETSRTKKLVVAIAIPAGVPHCEMIRSGIIQYSLQHKSWEFRFAVDGTMHSLEGIDEFTGDGLIAMVESQQDLRRVRRLALPTVNVASSLLTRSVATVSVNNLAARA